MGSTVARAWLQSYVQGRAVSTKRVARLMRGTGLQGKKRRRYATTTDSKHSGLIAPNLLERDFHQDGPNQAWVTDVTAVYTGTGWLYLAALIDLFSRTAIGWATSATNDTALALAALEVAVEARRPPRGVVASLRSR